MSFGRFYVGKGSMEKSDRRFWVGRKVGEFVRVYLKEYIIFP